MVTPDPHALVVAVLGLGEAGSAIAADLVAAGVRVRGYDPAVTPADGITATAGEAEAARGADLVLSVNSAKAAVDALAAGLDRLRPDALWADLNTAAPGTKRQLAGIAEAVGVPFTDVAMMAPVPGRGLRVPMLASGPGAARYASVLTPLGANVEVLDGPAGLAASKKLLRSVFYKGMAAAVVEALDAARAADDEPWLREHIAAELTAADAGTIERIIDGTRRHAVRRAAEMEAAADMLTELGVPPAMAGASRALHERLAQGPPPASAREKRASGTPGQARALPERPQRLGQRPEGVRLRVMRQVDDHQVDSGVAESGGRGHRRFQISIRLDAQVDRAGDLVHVASDGGAVPGQHVL
jgi:3-hydroxyisobutyrate dehydrogenase-like beta-hydroxyacid dehydrogenase